MMPGRQVVQHVSHHRVILDFYFVAVFEDQHGLRLIGHRSLRRLGRSRFCFGLGSVRSLRIRRNIWPRRLSRPSTIENCRPTTIIIFRIRIRFWRRISLFRVNHYRVRHINRTARREKRILAMVRMPLKKWRIRIYWGKRVDATSRRGEKLAVGLYTVWAE